MLRVSKSEYLAAFAGCVLLESEEAYVQNISTDNRKK